MEETNSSFIPVQTISYAKKIAKDYEWGKNTIRAYINRSYFSNVFNREDIKKLYDYYNGHIDIEDYALVTSPFGKKLEGNWSDVVNYPIIAPKVNLLLGEFAERPSNKEVYLTNDDVVNESLEEKNLIVLQTLEQLFVNTLNQNGVDTGIPSEEVPTPERLVEEQLSSYRDKRAILGQHALDYIEQYCKLQEKFQEEFKHWLIAGEVYSYSTVENNEPYYEVVNPLDIDYDKDPDIQFIEDADWVIRRKFMNVSSIVEFFYDDLGKTEKERKDMINKLEQIGSQDGILSIPSPNINDGRRKNMFNRLIEVKHVVWKSKAKKGICTFTDEFGQQQSIEVDENFKPLDELGQTVEWYWVNEIWEGYYIGIDIFLRIRPVPIQRTSLDNLAKCKLPYNGRVFSATNSRNISLVMLGVPYQLLYNATFHRLKMAMAKMKDDMLLLDPSLKPANMSIEEWLAMGESIGILLSDLTKEGNRGNTAVQQVLKFASTTIAAYTELLAFIKQEWNEVCGISDQREGQITSSETVGGVERSVLQSSLITAIYHNRFDEFKEREYQALLDISKFAWINGKKTSFIMPDSAKTVYMDIDPIQHSEAEYGVFVALSGKAIEKRKKLEAQFTNFIQNGAKASTIIDVINSDNFSEMKTKFLKAEQSVDEYNQQMELMKGEQQKEIMAMQDAQLKKQHEYKLKEIDRKGEWDLRGKEVTAYAIDDEGGATDNIAEVAIEAGIKERELGIKQQEVNLKAADIAQKDRSDKIKSDTEKYKADMSLKVAKAKPKPTAKKK